MNLQKRIDLLKLLEGYLSENSEEWQNVKNDAFAKNGWFIPAFINKAVQNIVNGYLQDDKIQAFKNHYRIDDNILPRKVGLVMAGNIPLVGFHDFLCIFLSGHIQMIKLSSKDDVLLKHIVAKMTEWDSGVKEYVMFSEMLKDCDAYVATGSNNTSRYFRQYFDKYPNIIRQNRTSVAILTGIETEDELKALADDVHLFFGLGCRNVTKIYVPAEYNFEPLLEAFKKYDFFSDHHKYKNNYDYQLSIALMNNIYYMTNGFSLLIEDESLFTAVSRLNYSFYENVENISTGLQTNIDVQCIIGKAFIPFGEAQKPGLMDYADGVDSMQFLLTL